MAHSLSVFWYCDTGSDVIVPFFALSDKGSVEVLPTLGAQQKWINFGVTDVIRSVLLCFVVTPGSVAAAGLAQGDQILKIGTIPATNLSHMEGQELIKRAGNILQLTIKKSPASPPSSYGSQVTAQLHDNQFSPPQRAQYVQQNHAPTTHTRLPDGSTRIQIQRSPAGYQSSDPPLPPTPTRAGYDTFNDSGLGMPDYTIPYRASDPYHEHQSAGGGLYSDDVYRPSAAGSQNAYNVGSSMSLPRGVGYGSQQEPRSVQISFSSRDPSQSQPQQVRFNPTQAYESRIGSRQPDPLEDLAFYPSSNSAFSPSNTQPLSPRGQQSSAAPSFTRVNVSSPYSSEPSRPQASSYSSSPYSQPQPSSYGRSTSQQGPTSPTSSYTQQPSYQSGAPSQRGYNQPASYEPSPISSQQNAYQPQRPQYQQQNSYSSRDPDPYTPMSSARPEAPPSYAQTFPRRQPSYERGQSFGDRNNQYNDGYVPNSQFNQAGVSDFGYSEPVSSYSEPQRTAPEPYRPAEPMRYEPQPGDGVYEARPTYTRTPSRQDSIPTSPGVRSAQPDYISPARPTFSPQSSRDVEDRTGGYRPERRRVIRTKLRKCVRPKCPVDVVGSGTNLCVTPAGISDKHTSHFMHIDPVTVKIPLVMFDLHTDRDEGGQKIPDELLSSVLKSKGGGPKPFSYGVDLNELKKKIGPPTAPKTYKKKPGMSAPQEHGPASVGTYENKPSAGYVQKDYVRARDEGPRAEIDESHLPIHMGTNPKKQSMSFKVLQWMTDTENTQDEPGKQGGKEEPPQRTRRQPRDPTVHNAEDDEMRFTGLHPKTNIPSKSFNRLQKIPGESNQNHTTEVKDEEEEEERVGNYDEASIRYKGKHIPSPSFRVLQTWAEMDPLDSKGQGQDDEEDDGMPDTLSAEEVTDRRYKGGHIPSKVFRTLQKAVGDDTPETPPPEQQNGDAVHARPKPPPPVDSAAATDF
ncbi:hypothetical protein BaRGS_00006783 [Batillaria attramentaria]|uniref:PDZ domain-containing protein n=1 Tax=Batillaria attramentaria TaxID=370345 RepID=A0ABD0LRB7_9CAEN